MKAFLKRTIRFNGIEFLKGVHDAVTPKTKTLFEKHWFLEALKEVGDLVLHQEEIEAEAEVEKPVKSGKKQKIAEEAAKSMDVDSMDASNKDGK